MKLPISVVVITKNESAHIERCLRSVPWAGEMLVVDSGSTDDTVAKAQALGARVLNEAWRGFGPQKKLAAKLAQHDWILSLDADEALSPELSDEIQRRFQELNPRAGYEMPRQSYHLGRWIRYGGWYPDWQLRLFHRQNSQWDDAPLHERVVSPEKARLENRLLHWVFDDLAEQVATNNRYSSLQAEEWSRQGRSPSLANLILKPVSKFFECYLLKRGFLDGRAGFIIAVSAGYSAFLRAAKLWEKKTCKSSS